jgi:ketosteroid isomerase-like protein
MKKFLALLVVVGLAGGCDYTCEVESADQLLEVDREFSQMSVEQGIDKAFDFYMADSATMLRDSVPPITGRDAINKLYEGIPEGTELSWEALFADISSSGDLGYTIGRWQYSASDTSGVVQTSYGHYVTIWKKQDDGSWKYVFDSGTSGTGEEK